jgi:hypothetical protein
MILWIPQRLPTLNELIDAKATRLIHPVTKRPMDGNLYGKLKKKWAAIIATYCLQQRVKKLSASEVYWSYLFVCEDRRTDPSNISSGGIKVVEDALQMNGLLKNDGWAQVHGIQAHILLSSEIDFNPHIGCLVSANTEPVAQSEMYHLLRGKLLS